MIITSCPWEEVNLGVKTIEVKIEEKDSFSEDEFAISKKDASYIVIKVPVNKPDFLIGLSKIGFTFIEAQYQVSKKIKEFDFNDRFIKSLLPKISFSRILSETQLEELISNITPNMFCTDRIYIDPFFKKGASCKRYTNWLRNELGKDDINISYMNLNGEKVGFFMEKYDKNNSENLLAGIFECAQGFGLGILTPSGSILSHHNDGSNLYKITTAISSNNIPVFNLYQYLNFNIDKTYYVFVKHQ